MSDRIHIQMMDRFAVYINDRQEVQMLNSSRKGLMLIEYLILNRGQQIPNQKLLMTCWPEEENSNPAVSLKTLISRTRTTLNKISEGMGSCIVTDRGGYHWEMLPEMTIDLYEIEDIIAELQTCGNDREKYGNLIEHLMDIYKGDLLQNNEPYEWVVSRSIQIHENVMNVIDSYLKMLQKEKDFENMIRVCRQALDIDNFSEQMHMHLMTALVETNRNNEAMLQYKHATHLQYRYLGIQPSEEMQEFYKQIVNAGRTLEFNLESIRNELLESENQQGAFVCEYAVFKEIFNLQIRNLERLKTTMFLAVIMVSDIKGDTLDSMKQASIVDGLMEILKMKLRKGDAITHFSPTMLALLLPTVDYRTAGIVMERIKKLFYAKYSNSEVKFDYRVGPLCSAMQMMENRD